jgi:lysozyme
MKKKQPKKKDYKQIIFKVFTALFTIIASLLLDARIKKAMEERPKTNYKNVEAFIEKYGPIVTKKCYNTPIFASVALGQLAQESGWGKHTRTMFGIKDVKKKGNKLKTKEFINGKWITINDSFLEAKDAGQAVDQYIELLTTKKRYRKVLEAQTPEEQVKEIKKAGYATDPKYIKWVLGCIKTGKLKALDNV